MAQFPDAYKPVTLLPLGSADCLSILLLPAYRPVIRIAKMVTRTIKSGHRNVLQGCLESTDWSILLTSVKSELFHQPRTHSLDSTLPHLQNTARSDQQQPVGHHHHLDRLPPGLCALTTTLHPLHRPVQDLNHIVLLSPLCGPTQHHGPALQQSIEWCNTSQTQLNVSKTKKRVVTSAKR